MAANETLAVYLNQHSLVECFDAADGAKTWTVDLADHRPAIYQQVVAVDDVVVASGWRPVATAIRGGDVVWAMASREPVVGPPGTVLLPVPARRSARLVAATSGAVLTELPYPMRASRWTGTHFVGADESHCVNAVDLDGHVSRLITHSDAIVTDVPAVIGDTILFEDERWRLCAYDSVAGHWLWRDPIYHRWAGKLPAAMLDLAVTPSGAVLAGIDGRIVALA
jgi:hypothetical protein